MRTTIDIPSDLRRKLIEEAAARNLRGFSSLIVEALRWYFSNKTKHREESIQKLKGCMSSEQTEKERSRLREVRRNWRR